MIGLAGTIVYGFVAMMNVVTLSICSTDRNRIRGGTWRYPTSAIIIYSLMGGSLGALAGIMLFGYKKKHNHVMQAITGIFVIQITTLCFMLIINII